MDYDERIAKVETLVETLRKDMDRLYDAVERLRQHTDSGFEEMRTSLEAQRRETSANIRWMTVGMAFFVVLGRWHGKAGN